MQEREQYFSPIKQRILLYAGTLGISKRDFYAKMGVSRGTLESKTGITEDVLAKFFATYPEVNIHWVMTGDGSMLEHESISKTNLDKKENSPVAIPATKPGEGIPLIPIDAMAGAMTGDQTVLDYECDHYTVPGFKGSDFLIPVKGSSMSPTYNSGDIVACKRIPMGDIFFQWNKVYVIDTNQGALIKRIKPSSDPRHILIVSDNPDYDPFELSVDAIRAVAIVIGVIHIDE